MDIVILVARGVHFIEIDDKETALNGQEKKCVIKTQKTAQLHIQSLLK